MIVDKIESYLGGEALVLDEALVKAMGDQVVASTKRQFMQNQAPVVGSIRPSALGKCPRQGWYVHKGTQPDEPLAGRARFVFWFGDVVETAVLGLARMAGCPVSDFQREVPMEIANVPMVGHIDALLQDKDGPVVVDVKSMSSVGFKMWKENGPSNDFGYVDQLQAYMRGLDIQRALFVCVNKEQGHLAEYEIGRNDEMFVPRAEAYVRQATQATEPERAYKLEDEIVKAQGRENAEKILYSNKKAMILSNKGAWWSVKTGRGLLPVTCGYCSFKERCWTGVKLEAEEGSKPKWVMEG